MKWMQDIVFYEGKEQEVRILIKKLELSSTTYCNKRRNDGWTAQKAFEHCVTLKKRKDYLKAANVEELARKKEVSVQAVYKSLNNGKEPTEILSDSEIFKKKRKYFQSLLSNIGLSLEYKSVYDFCIREGLNVSSVYKNLENGMTLYDAVAESFSIQLSHNVKNIYLGILVKSLAQKYRLDYDSVQFLFCRTHDYVLSFYKAIFNQLFSDYSPNKKKILWQTYIDSFLNDSSLLPKDVIDDKILNLFFRTYWCYQSIQKDFCYYQFLLTLPISDFISLSLEERVARLLAKFVTLPFSIEEIYFILDFEHGLMREFTYVETHQVWVYSGNREVLKKLIKPSN